MEALGSSPFPSFRFILTLTRGGPPRTHLQKPVSNHLTLLINQRLPYSSLSSTHRSKVDLGQFTASSSSSSSNPELLSKVHDDEEEVGSESMSGTPPSTMATRAACLQVSTAPFKSTVQHYLKTNIGSPKQQQPQVPLFGAFPGKKQTSRRLVSISLVLLQWLCTPITQSAFAGTGSMLDKYVKRKKLDPLESYVPAVLLTEFQIKDLGKTLEVDNPQFASFRSLLRSGPAASLRVNIRAVAQYASDSGNGKDAFQDVDQCLGALEDLDSLFLRASRNDKKASVESMKAKIVVALSALDSLLGTVPSDVLDKGKAIADAYRVSEDIVPETLDPKMKELESIL